MKMQIFNYTNLLSKNKHSLFLCLFALLLVSCNDEKVVDDPVKEPENGTSITIEGDVIDPPKDSRSTDPIVYFTGGHATGAGLYDGDKRPTVAAHPNDGYEVDFFYGGPETASSKQYDYASSGSTSFTVPLYGVNHYFKCGFKEKKRTLTLVANPTAGGTVSGAGTYKVKQAIPIKATPKNGYTFSGWSVTSGDAKIANASSASTTATLQSSSSTLQANFKVERNYQYTIAVDNPAGDTSSALSIDSSGNYDDIYEGYNNQTYTAQHGETVELSIRYQSDKVNFAGWYENGTLLSTAETYTFTPSDTPNKNRSITGKFVMKPSAEPTLTFYISAESPVGCTSSGSIEVNIDGNKTILNMSSGIKSFTITGQQKAVLTVKDLPDYIDHEGYWLGWYVTYNGSERQVSTSYTFEITTQGDLTNFTARFSK